MELTAEERALMVRLCDDLADQCRTNARMYEDLAESVANGANPSLLDQLAMLQSEFAT